MNQPTLILASASPRRRELLAVTGWEVEIRPVDVDETPRQAESASALASRLATAKAYAAAHDQERQDLVLAADTVVVVDGRLLGKPADHQAAQAMLLELRAREHEVITAITLLDVGHELEVQDSCQTSVPMRAYPQDELRAYIESGSPFDKAGGYGIQDRSFQPVALARLSGCFANVMGLPLCHLVRSMKRLGYQPPENVPFRCQAHLNYDCPVYMDILKD
jgi:MAF protein